MIKFSKSTNNFYKLRRCSLYYDNVNAERNIDFVLNLGMNRVPDKISSNLNIFTLFKFLLKRKFIGLMKRNYREMLKSMASLDTSGIDRTAEPRLKYVIYSDLVKLSKKGFHVKVVNESAQIYLKILNVYELQNVNVDRDFNGDLDDYEIKYKGKSKIILSKADPNITRDRRSLEEIEKDREIFEGSDFKDLSLNRLRENALMEFNVNYAKVKMGKNQNEQNLEYISNLIDNLNKSEKEDNPYSAELKNEFKDYYSARDKHIMDRVNSTDLYEYFRINFPSHYNKLFSAVKSKNIGIARTLMTSLRKHWLDRFSERSKTIAHDKTLYVVDVEMVSQMRLDILDKEGRNVLETVYNYSNVMKSSSNMVSNNNELLDYDTSIYKFTIPESKWNTSDRNYMQTHLVRFEFEKKTKFKNILKSSYDTLMITDIDLALKGNKHFNFNSKSIL